MDVFLLLEKMTRKSQSLNPSGTGNGFGHHLDSQRDLHVITDVFLSSGWELIR